MKSFGFAEHEHVEPACDPQACGQANRQYRRDGCRFGPGCAAQRSQQPERDVAQLAIVRHEHQKSDAGIGNGGDGKACQQEDGDRRAAGAAGDSIEDDGRRQRAGECGDRQQFVLQEPKTLADPAVGEHYRCGRCECATAGNADQCRIGEGIPEQALHDGA